MVSDSRQALIVRLGADVARAARAFLAQSEGAYSGLDELLEVALVNQLNVEGFRFDPSLRAASGQFASDEPEGAQAEGGVARAHKSGNDVAAAPSGSTAGLTMAVDPVAAIVPDDDAMFVMTNRISPIKVAARALALLANEQGAWPTVVEFHERASMLARQVGLRLRRDGSRRWVGFPIGADVAKARDRFVGSFTITVPNGCARGPMAILGLAGPAPAGEAGPQRRTKSQARNVSRVGLTEAGWQLAILPSPIFGECDGDTLSPAEAEIVTHQLLAAPQERVIVREFLGLVRRAGGVQSRVDELMAARASGKSADLLVAERAALVGRLVDLHLVEHQGRGADARIDLTERGRELLSKLQSEQRERNK